MNTKIHKIGTILKNLNDAIVNKHPFSLIRFGDGGIKLMHSLLYNDVKQFNDISKREGLPEEKLMEILTLWSIYANKADYIDTPEVYFTNRFWGRYRKYMKNNVKDISKKTKMRLLMWKELYSDCGIKIDKVKFCNPEANWLSILKNPPNRNLLEIMKNRKVCCISTYQNVPSLSKQYDIKFWKIAGHNQNQYINSFNDTVDFIKYNANNYDLWLNSSGELGRIYSGLIKDLGGRVFDLGFVIDYFINFKINVRLEYFIKTNPRYKKELVLTDIGENYRKFI